jgi:hypothetical protein
MSTWYHTNPGVTSSRQKYLGKYHGSDVFEVIGKNMGS